MLEHSPTLWLRYGCSRIETCSLHYEETWLHTHLFVRFYFQAEDKNPQAVFWSVILCLHQMKLTSGLNVTGNNDVLQFKQNYYHIDPQVYSWCSNLIEPRDVVTSTTECRWRLCSHHCLSVRLCLSVCEHDTSKNLSTDSDEIWWTGWVYDKEELIRFWWISGSRCGYDNFLISPRSQSEKRG